MDEKLTVNDVAKILGCSPSLVRRGDMREALGGFRVGKRGIRFYSHKVAEYIARNAFSASVQPESKPRQRIRNSKNLTSGHELW
ncbi:MAG: helix-turn-helix domain-containing protein [Pseudodesulfovibrio sp.]|nr:helix-turn-helix domain-containing protein [Pseudodesulfovibrio sp.]